MAIVLTGASFGRRLVRDPPNSGFGQNLLASTLAAVAAPARGDFQDVPRNRIGAHYAAALAAAGFNLLVGTLALAPDGAARAAVFTGRPQTVPAAPFAPPNLLLTTLAAPAAPFAQGEWPNPRTSAHSLAFRTWAHGTPLVLIGQDRFFAADGQAPVYDWPNPRPAARAPEQSPQQNLLSGPLAPAGAAPFAQVEWPNPRGPLHFGGALHFSRTDTGTPEAAPFAAPEWRNPAGRPTPPPTWTQNLLQSTLSVAPPAPFAQVEWPNPRGPQYSAGLRTWTQWRHEFPAVAAPFAQTQWQLPPAQRRHPTAPRSFRPDLAPDTFFGAPGQVPQHHWQLPVRARHPVALRTWSANLLESTLFAAPAAPFAPAQWQLPPWTRRQFAAPQWFRPEPVPEAAPFAQGEWPNPRGPQYSAELRTWTQWRHEFPALPAPFAQTHWPNPAGYRYSVGLRTFAEPPKLQSTLAPAAPAPFAQVEWPNPRGPQYSTGLRTWTQRRYEFPALPAPFSQTHWPNPAGYRYSVALRAFDQALRVVFVPPPVYGWGARGRVGSAAASDQSQRIGSETAQDGNTRIGSQTAQDGNKRIGSDEA